MSRSKSQLSSNLDVRTKTAASLSAVNVTSSIASSRTRDSFKSAFFNFMRDFKQKHKNKHYGHVMRLGARRWHTMTQADRAVYILEAARNRRTAKLKSKRPERKTASDKKKSKSEKKENADNRRCPACGHRKNSRQKSRTHSESSRGSSHSSSNKSSRSSNSK